MTTPTKVSVNALDVTREERPWHPTQPDDRLVPAMVEIDDQGNPVFQYKEPTPRKQSPKFVAPQSLLKRLAMKASKSNTRSSVACEYQTDRHNEIISPQVLSLHESFSMDEPLSEDDDALSVQSSASSLAGDVTSIAKMKLRLRRNRRNKINKGVEKTSIAILSPLKETDVNGVCSNRGEEKKNNHKKQHVFRRNFARRTSANTSSTRSMSSRASSLKDMDVPSVSSESRRGAKVLVKALVEAPYPSKEEGMTMSMSMSMSKDDENALPPVEPREIKPSTSVVELTGPPPIATLKSAMESMSRHSESMSRHSAKQNEASDALPVPTTVKVLTPLEPMATPPPIPTLKAAMEAAMKAAAMENEATNQSEPFITSSTQTLPSIPSSLSEDNMTKKKKTAAPEVTTKTTAKKTKDKAVRKQKSSVACPSTTSNSLVCHHDPTFKIFMLLLHPTSKIFELIQLFFNPATTTIGDVMYMIPTNATEPALGNQRYVGLCRKEYEQSVEIKDMDLLVQNHDNMKESAQIVHGEILVAIPDGYTAEEVANLSQQILCNPRICRLMESSDPLAPRSKTKRRSSRRGHKSRRRSRKSVEVLEKHDEEPNSVQVAMEKAEKAAAIANAAIHELPRLSGGLVTAVGKSYQYSTTPRGTVSLENTLDNTVSTSAATSLADASERSYSIYENSIDQSLDTSVDHSFNSGSFSSWSRSLNTSMKIETSPAPTPLTTLLPGPVPVLPSPVVRRRNARRKVFRLLALGVAVSVHVIYFIDPNGFSSRSESFVSRFAVIGEQPMGMTGIIQVSFILLVLCKVQFLCSLPTSHSPASLTKRCPFMNQGRRKSFA